MSHLFARAVLFFSAAAFAASCSSDKDESKKGGRGTVDISGFENTLDKEGFNLKSKEASDLVNDVGSIRGDILYKMQPNLTQGYSKNLNFKSEDCSYLDTIDITVNGRNVPATIYNCAVTNPDGSVKQCTKVSYVDGGIVQNVYNCEGQQVDPNLGREELDRYRKEFLGDIKLNFSQPGSCSAGFDQFDALYARLKSELYSLTRAVNGSGFGLSGTGLAGLELVESKADKQSLLSFDYQSNAGDQLVIRGKLSAGASHNMLLVKQNYAITMPGIGAGGDTKKMSIKQKQHIVADFDKHVIELVSSGSIVSGALGSAINGFITVTSGKKKSVKINLKMKNSGGRGGSAARLVIDSQQIDANTLVFSSSIASNEGGGQYGFTLRRDVLGQCRVENYKNTFGGASSSGSVDQREPVSEGRAPRL